MSCRKYWSRKYTYRGIKSTIKVYVEQNAATYQFEITFKANINTLTGVTNSGIEDDIIKYFLELIEVEVEKHLSDLSIKDISFLESKGFKEV